MNIVYITQFCGFIYGLSFKSITKANVFNSDLTIETILDGGSGAINLLQLITTKVTQSLYGEINYIEESEENKFVKEIKYIVLVPQTGSHLNITILKQVHEHPYLSDLKPLWWIHTQPNESITMPSYDCQLTTIFFNNRRNLDIETEIVITGSFIQGSYVLNRYQLSTVGYDWIENIELNINYPKRFNESNYEKLNLFQPKNSWDISLFPVMVFLIINFICYELTNNMNNGLQLGTIKDFNNEIYLPRSNNEVNEEFKENRDI